MRALRLLTLGLWLAGPILLARAGLAFLRGRRLGRPVEVALWRATFDLSGAVLESLALALLCALLALGVARLRSARSAARRAQTGAREGRLSRALASRAGLALGALVAVLAPAALLGLSALFPPLRPVREVARQIAGAGDWEVVRRHPEHAPATGVLTPVPDGSVDGGDLPSIVMPPPCEVRFAVRAEDGPVVLRGAAGVDHTFFPRRHKGLERCRIAFEVLVNGAPAFAAQIEPVFQGTRANRSWRRFGAGRDEIALVPGDVVTLRTALAEPARDPAATPRIPAGFGALELVRGVERRLRRASPEAPNIVLIVMDTLRADRTSLHGYELPTTPELEALAARGLVFDNAYATSSWTWPSTASLLTGLWPETHGVVSDASCYLAGELETLAEVLARRDYVTAAFSCNPLIVAGKNFDQGFERFDEPPGNAFRGTGAILGDVEEWLARNADARFFLYLHLVDTHFPYAPLPEARALAGGERPADYPAGGLVDYHKRLLAGEGCGPDGALDLERVVPRLHQDWMHAAYDQAVATADAYVGRVVRRIRRLGLEGRTVVVFTSDHGEELLDHGLATHGQTLHTELVRAPLVLAGPGIPAGLRVATPVSNRHLAPTLARLGGAELAALADRLDLVRLDSLEQQPVFLSTQHGWWNGRHRLAIHGVRDGSWSLHLAPEGLPWGAPPGGDAGRGDVRLFDLAADPAERRDLSAAHPDVVQDLLALLAAHLAQAERGRPALSLGAGGSTLQMLRDIGYAGDGE